MSNIDKNWLEKQLNLQSIYVEEICDNKICMVVRSGAEYVPVQIYKPHKNAKCSFLSLERSHKNDKFLSNFFMYNGDLFEDLKSFFVDKSIVTETINELLDYWSDRLDYIKSYEPDKYYKIEYENGDTLSFYLNNSYIMDYVHYYKDGLDFKLYLNRNGGNQSNVSIIDDIDSLSTVTFTSKLEPYKECVKNYIDEVSQHKVHLVERVIYNNVMFETDN